MLRDDPRPNAPAHAGALAWAAMVRTGYENRGVR